MGLNIKNERVCALAKRAAEELGTTQTSAIEQALEAFLAEHAVDRERAEREKAERVARARRTLDEIHAMVTDEDRAQVRAFQEEMHDETGLPA